MLTVSVIFPLLLFGYASWANYRAAFERADDQIRQALDLSAEHALRVFRSITVTFDSVEQITRGRTERTLRANAAELSERLKQFVSALPDIGSVWILNAEGDAIVSSLFFPLPPAANAPEWAWLRSQLANDASLHIGDVLRIQPAGSLIFPISKWRTDSSGTFSGITEISVSPAAFERFYAPLAERTSASFGLIREDGAVLARYPVPTIAGI
jgi:two-component system NtrC family sensor kinase